MEKKRPLKEGLCTWTPKIIDSMIYLQTFKCKDIETRLPEISRRRITDVLSILRGSGFIEKGPLKKYYTFVGMKGTRALFESFKGTVGLSPTPFKAPTRRKLSHYCGRRLVQLFAFRNTWDHQELRRQLCDDTTNRRFYDIISVFKGAGLVEKTPEKMFEQRIELLGSSRILLTISDEDAVAILPELKDHLVLHKTEVMIFYFFAKNLEMSVFLSFLAFSTGISFSFVLCWTSPLKV